nr:aldehyde dehydrogenase family protein [Desulfobacterales bacterium]
MATKTYLNFIDGEWAKSDSEETFADINPANFREVIGFFQASTLSDLERAIVSAATAFEKWRFSSLSEREEIFRKAIVLLEQRKEKLALELTREEGKTLQESHKEILSAINEMRFQVGQARRFLSEPGTSGRRDIVCYSVRQPLGVVSIITPWNFPVNVPCRKITPALMAGNTVVFKPASFTPLSGLMLVEILIEAGIPKGVLNFITGKGSEIGDRMVTHPLIKAVSFTGSTEVGMKICQQAPLHMAKVQLEMGGKNPMVVLEDADLELAVKDAISAGYACSGQWCTSTSRLILHREIAEQFLDLLVDEVRKIKVGDGLDPKTTMGPVAGEEQLKKITSYIELGKKEGAKLIFGGKRLTGYRYDRGFFIEPAIFTQVKPEMKIAQEEIFGPVLSVMAVDSFNEALKVANAVKHGLSSSIYTRDLVRAMEFVNKSEVGLTHINLPTSFKEPQLPFGGIKLSGYGIPEAGRSGIEFFTENKSIYINPGSENTE